MCKHVSAVLYGVGVLIDTKPDLLFTLRGVDQAELLSEASIKAITDVSSSGGDLAGSDLSAIFGIDLSAEVAVSVEEEPMDQKKTAKKKAGVNKVSKTPKSKGR